MLPLEHVEFKIPINLSGAELCNKACLFSLPNFGEACVLFQSFLGSKSFEHSSFYLLVCFQLSLPHTRN